MNEQTMFYIKILAPVHIGCDEVYEPAGFVINEPAAMLAAFDPLDFFRSLDAQTKDRYAVICRKGTVESIVELYKFMKNRQFEGPSVKVNLSKEFVNHYKESFSKNTRDFQKELNQFSIARTSYNPTTQKPYIPGTAVKGALRTAYLNTLAKSRKINIDRHDKKKGETLEKGLLDYKTLEKDPFRLLKVSDFHPVGPCSTKIVYAVNEKKKESSRFRARGPYQILEVIEPGAVFTGTIQVLDPLVREAIKNPLKKEAVFKSAKIFYDKEMHRENDELKTAGIPAFSAVNENDANLLRLGRHSGAESITVEGYRYIKIMKERGSKDFSDKATTFWLASDASTGYQKNSLRPFGWVSLGPMTQSLKDELEALAAKQDSISVSAGSTSAPTTESAAKPNVPAPPAEETWANASVSFNPGGGGIVTAQSADKRRAEIRGKEKATAATDASLHKKLFEGKKTLHKARVTVSKAGNNWKIVKIEPQI